MEGLVHEEGLRCADTVSEGSCACSSTARSSVLNSQSDRSHQTSNAIKPVHCPHIWATSSLNLEVLWRSIRQCRPVWWGLILTTENPGEKITGLASSWSAAGRGGPQELPREPGTNPEANIDSEAADDDGTGIDFEENTLFGETVGSSVLESAVNGKELGDLLETVKREGWSRRESERVDRAIFTVIDDYDMQKMMQGISVPGPVLSPTVPWLPLVRPRSRRQHVRLESDALDADASAVPSGEPIRYKFDRTVDKVTDR
ncbi:hypothetical protein V8E54_002654 [Elaphomyces granulatus]